MIIKEAKHSENNFVCIKLSQFDWNKPQKLEGFSHAFDLQIESNIKNLSNHLSNLLTTLISRIFKITFQNRQFSVKSAWEVHRILMFQNDAVWYVLCSSWRDIGVLRARVLVYSDSMPTVVVYLKSSFTEERGVCIGFQSMTSIQYSI